MKTTDELIFALFFTAGYLFVFWIVYKLFKNNLRDKK